MSLFPSASDVRAFAEWILATPLSAAIQSAFWFIRLLQATHLLAAGIATASGVLIALRAAGWFRADQPFATVWARFAPWLSGSFAVMLATEIGQVLGDPVREFTSMSFWVKLVVVLVAVAGTWVIARVGRRDTAAGMSLVARVAAWTLVACWLAIPMLGRMIAYDRAIWGGWSMRR